MFVISFASLMCVRKVLSGAPQLTWYLTCFGRFLSCENALLSGIWLYITTGDTLQCDEYCYNECYTVWRVLLQWALYSVTSTVAMSVIQCDEYCCNERYTVWRILLQWELCSVTNTVAMGVIQCDEYCCNERYTVWRILLQWVQWSLLLPIFLRDILEALPAFSTHPDQVLSFGYLFVLLRRYSFTLCMKPLPTHLALHSALPIHHLPATPSTFFTTVDLIKILHLIQIHFSCSWLRSVHSWGVLLHRPHNKIFLLNLRLEHETRTLILSSCYSRWVDDFHFVIS